MWNLLDSYPPGSLGRALIERGEAMTRASVQNMVHAGRAGRDALAADLARRRRALAEQDRRLDAILRGAGGPGR